MSVVHIILGVVFLLAGAAMLLNGKPAKWETPERTKLGQMVDIIAVAVMAVVVVVMFIVTYM